MRAQTLGDVFHQHAHRRLPLPGGRTADAAAADLQLHVTGRRQGTERSNTSQGVVTVGLSQTRHRASSR